MLSRRILLGHGARATFLLPAAAAAWLSPRTAVAAPANAPSLLGAARAAGTDTGKSDHPPGPTPKPGAFAPFVMLDPGHGGKDPGAIGVTGTYEKHIALASARELMRQLNAGGRYRVELTRGDDVFIPLEERVEIARRKGAELFVSMHADALTDHAVRGASVYTLAGEASDSQTAALANRENEADRFAGPAFAGTSPEVARILASLVRQETRVGSARMARDVVAAFNNDIPLLQNPARHAGFVVLKAADIPSVLVEMGFMSNPQDEAALRRPDHRMQVASAMHRAIDAYFARTRTRQMAG